ncbi:MAG: zf-HC2 domain-containing protein [Thermoanaerobaculia bacterium]
MRCREVLDFLSDYLAGELPAETLERFEYHMSLCRPCVDYLETFRRTIELEKLSFDQTAEDPRLQEPPEELVRAVLAARGE